MLTFLHPLPYMQLKVYVGGISWNIDDQGLLDAFSQFGQCEATIMKDKYTGRSRGFGFVTYQSAEECTRAIEEMNGKCRVFCPPPGRVGNLETLCSGPAHDHGISCMCSAPSCYTCIHSCMHTFKRHAGKELDGRAITCNNARQTTYDKAPVEGAGEGGGGGDGGGGGGGGEEMAGDE